METRPSKMEKKEQNVCFVFPNYGVLSSPSNNQVLLGGLKGTERAGGYSFHVEWSCPKQR